MGILIPPDFCGEIFLPAEASREHRVVPHRVNHAQADELAEEQVVVQLLDQLALGTHGIKRMQQQRPQNILGGDRGTTGRRVKRIELVAQRAKNRIRQLADIANG